MADGDMLILSGEDVLSLLSGKEADIVNIIAAAYKAHGRGKSSLPHSLFLRFPDDQKNRIIALLAYLGDGFNAAGIKWIASFPENIRLLPGRLPAGTPKFEF